MKFQISQEILLKALQQLSGVVEKRQVLPVLGNILTKAEDNRMTLIATDLEVEVIVTLDCPVEKAGEVTIPARKWLDICRSFSEGVTLTHTLKEGRIILQTGRSRFTLSTLPAAEFPLIEEISSQSSFSIKGSLLRTILDSTHFSMAQQDVRYYLNGLMMEMSAGLLRCVATDGHRLAMKDSEISIAVDEDKRQVIVPRKGIQELMRLLSDMEDEIDVMVGSNHIRLNIGDMVLTSKLIDGRFPDYERVLPKGGHNIMKAEREVLRKALMRVAILSNEKYRGIHMLLQKDKLQLMAHNPEQEEAEDELVVDYQGDEFEIGFNANYILEAVNATQSDTVRITLSDANSSCVIQADGDESSHYVVMPMRL